MRIYTPSASSLMARATSRRIHLTYTITHYRTITTNSMMQHVTKTMTNLTLPLVVAALIFLAAKLHTSNAHTLNYANNFQAQHQQIRPTNSNNNNNNNNNHNHNSLSYKNYNYKLNLENVTHHNNPYLKSTSEMLLDLREQMLNKSIRFDDHFRSMLQTSKIGLHNMFVDTYGILYEHNTEIFTNMFESLENYYATGRVRLTQSIEHFFVQLYQKIFQVSLQHYAFGTEYLKCATEQLTHLRPFKDVPDKLTSEIRHTFVAARTFFQAMESGIDILKTIITQGQTSQCTNLIKEKLIKNTIIPVPTTLRIIPQRIPCLTYCEQVITRCFGRNNLEQIDEKWRAYVISLGDLATKLLTTYNIETTITPLDIQISEAIMNFQEGAGNITKSVFTACGTPKLQQETDAPVSSRLRRSSPDATSTVVRHSPSRIVVAPLKPTLPSMNLGGQLRGINGLGPVASILKDDFKRKKSKSPQLIDEVKSFMLSTKNFWSSLPRGVCSSNNTLGLFINYTKQPGPNKFACFQDQFSNTDVNSDLRYRAELQQQINRLDRVRSTIIQALNGVEIDWTSDADQRPTMVTPDFDNARTQSTISSMAITPTTDALENRDEEEDDDSSIVEHGSGEEIDEIPDDADTDEETFEVTDEPTSTESIATESIATDEANTTPSPANDLSNPSIPNMDNTLDNNPLNANDDAQLNLITPPDQLGVHRSSQTSNRLISHQILLLNLIFVGASVARLLGIRDWTHRIMPI